MSQTPDEKNKILFLCTGNSARSILAEFFLRKLDPIHFEVYSWAAPADPGIADRQDSLR